MARSDRTSNAGDDFDTSTGSSLESEFDQLLRYYLSCGYSDKQAEEYAEANRVSREQATNQEDHYYTNPEIDESQAIADYQRSNSYTTEQLNDTFPANNTSVPLVYRSVVRDEHAQNIEDNQGDHSVSQTPLNPYGYQQPPRDLYVRLPREELSNNHANDSEASQYRSVYSAHTDHTNALWLPFPVSVANTPQLATPDESQVPTRGSNEVMASPATSFSTHESSLDTANPQQAQFPAGISYGQTYTAGLSPSRSSCDYTIVQQRQSSTRVPRRLLYTPSVPSTARQEARQNILDSIQQAQQARQRSATNTNPLSPSTRRRSDHDSRPIPPINNIPRLTAPRPSQILLQPHLNTSNASTQPRSAPQAQLFTTTSTSPPPDPSQTYTTSLPNTYAGRRSAAARATYPFECDACKKRYLYLNSAQKHYRNSHGGELQIREMWKNAPPRPPPATPRNLTAVRARERGGSAGGSGTMAGQRVLPPVRGNITGQTILLPPRPSQPQPQPQVPSPLASIRARIASGEIPVPLPPSWVIDEWDASLTWVGRFRRWSRRARGARELDVWEYWDGEVGVWRRSVR